MFKSNLLTWLDIAANKTVKRCEPAAFNFFAGEEAVKAARFFGEALAACYERHQAARDCDVAAVRAFGTMKDRFMIEAVKAWPEGFRVTDDKTYDNFVLVTLLAPECLGGPRSLHFPKSRLGVLELLGVKVSD